MEQDEKTLVELLDQNSPIDLNKYTNFVATPQSGAIATFAGTTRDTFDGKTVVELRYEAYVPMAVRQLRSVCSSARSSWALDKIAVAHRTGPVPVGQTSVFVAVSAVHRAEALDACKYIIDEIKASVPIWKKEVYSNGEVWKENSEFLERSASGLQGGGGPAHPRNGGSGGGCCGRKVREVVASVTLPALSAKEAAAEDASVMADGGGDNALCGDSHKM